MFSPKRVSNLGRLTVTPVDALHTTQFHPTRVKHCKIHTLVLIQGERGGGKGGSEPVRRLEGRYFTKGVEYTIIYDWLYLQSTNSTKHQLRRHSGFGVFIIIWSMIPTNKKIKIISDDIFAGRKDNFYSF